MEISAEKKISSVSFLPAEILQHIKNFGSAGDLIGFDDEKKEALYSLGHYQYTQGKYAEAFRIFQIIVINDPLNQRAIKAVGSCLQMLNFYEDAMKHLSIALYMEPSDPGPALQIAECMLALNRKENAITILKEIKKEFESKAEYEEITIKVRGLLDFIIK